MAYANNWRFPAIGTVWNVETCEPIQPELQQKILDRIYQFDMTYSRFKPNSLLRTATSKAGSCTLPAEAMQLFNLYRTLSDLSAGRISPLVGAQLHAAGYDETYSLMPAKTIPTGLLDRDYFSYEAPILTVLKPCMLDFGAAGKGYLADIVADILQKNAIKDFTIDASGDIVRYTTSGTSELIGLENPLDSSQVIGTVSLTTGSLCASATQRRSWGKNWHHVIDVQTGKPTSDILASWVIADTGLIADGLATALFFVTPEDLENIFSFNYVTISAEGEVKQSANFPGQMYS